MYTSTLKMGHLNIGMEVAGKSGAIWFGGLGTYKVRILDDGTNYKIDLINTTTGNSVLPNVASIAKASVRAF